MSVLLEKAKDPNVGGGVDRAKLKDSDFVFSDTRTFPVVTPGDVSDAVSSWGRYKGPHSFDDFKRNLTALAHRKGPSFVSALPAEWTATKGSVQTTMHEFKHGALHSGSKRGPKVTSRRQAIAIALSQAARAKTKELVEKADYHARAGQTIAGNLVRGANGKFQSGGAGGASKKSPDVSAALQRGNKILESRQPKDKPYKTLPPPKGGKGGKGGKKGGGKGGKAKPTPEEAKAQADKNRTEVLGKVLGPDLTEALTVGDTPGDLSGVKPEYGDKLVEAGMAKKLADGSYVTTPAARQMLRAAEKGDLATAQRIAKEAASAATSRASAQARTSPSKAPLKAPAARLGSKLAKIAVNSKKPPAASKPKGGGGGGKAAPAAKPTPDQKLQAQRQKRDATLSKALPPELVDAVAKFADDPTAALDPKAAKQLTDMGILQQDTTGQLRMSGTAHMLMNAATRGDERAVRDALSRAQDQAQHARDAAAKLAAAAAKKKPAKEPPVKKTAREAGGLFIIKQADGRYRWITFSSSAFEDRDDEIVTLKSLQLDVDRADRDGDYGPLLWWHMPEMVLGHCDYNTMIGRILVESGTFKSARIAQAMERHGHMLGVSIGFWPLSMKGNVYELIRRKERSLLPEPVTSNRLTKLFVRKNKMKLDILKKLLGNGPEAEATLKEITEEATTKERQAIAEGLRTKGLDLDQLMADTTKAARPPIANADAMPMGGQTAPEVTPPVKKADGVLPDMAAMGTPEEGMMEGEGDGDEGEYEDSEADITIDAIVQALHDGLDAKILSSIQAALDPIKATIEQAMSANADTTTKETSAIALILKEAVGQLASMKATVTELEARVKELSADVPPAVAQRLRASHSPATVVKETDVLQRVVPPSADTDPYALSIGNMLNSFGQRPFAGGVGSGQQQ